MNFADIQIYIVQLFCVINNHSLTIVDWINGVQSNAKNVLGSMRCNTTQESTTMLLKKKNASLTKYMHATLFVIKANCIQICYFHR